MIVESLHQGRNEVHNHQIKIISVLNLSFLFALGYYSFTYLLFSKQPQITFLFLSFISLFLSIMSGIVQSKEIFILSPPPNKILFWTYSSLSIFLLFTFLSDAWNLFNEPSYNQEIFIQLGSLNILYLRILGLIWFSFSSYLCKSIEIYPRGYSYFSYTLITIVFLTSLYFGYWRNPNRVFLAETSNANKIQIILDNRIVFETKEPANISQILDMIHFKWWNSISRGVCNCAGLPTLEVEKDGRKLSFEIAGDHIVGLDFPGNLELTEDSQQNVRTLLASLKKNQEGIKRDQ